VSFLSLYFVEIVFHFVSFLFLSFLTKLSSIFLL
jgi:hypothetical protein